MKETITCEIADVYDNTTEYGLDADLHEGITIGNGKKMYWYICWHSKSGNCTVFSPVDMIPRYIKRPQQVTIHFK